MVEKEVLLSLTNALWLLLKVIVPPDADPATKKPWPTGTYCLGYYTL